jgi:hypothetical protein
MSPAKPHPSEAFRKADPALKPVVRELHARLTATSLDLPAIKRAMIALLEFLSSPAGRTDANCRAVDSFFFHDDTWLTDQLPEPYHDVIAHMDALHDTIVRQRSQRISVPRRSNSWRKRVAYDT